MSVAYQHVTSDVPAPSVIVHGLAPELDELVRRATDRDPDGRPADAGAFGAQVRAVRGRLSAAQLGFAPVGVDLTDTLVVPLPGLPGAAGALGIGALTAAGAHHTATLAPPTRLAPGRGIKPPSTPVVGGPGQIPKAARGGGRRRGAVIGLVVLLVLATGLGAGAWYLGAGRWTTTPSVLDLPKSAALAKIEAAGLKVAIGPSQHSETVRPGYVISTDPAPGGRVAKSGTVTLVLSIGPQRYLVPKLVNQSVADATAALTAQHLAVGTQTSAYSDTVARGDVISTSPAAGTAVKPDTAVRLVVSKGVAPATVPSLVNLTLAQAQAAAAAAKVTLDSSAPPQYSLTVPSGSVLSQGTKTGTQVTRGTTITVVLSQGPPLVVVPDVVSMTKNQARKILEAAGFVVTFYDFVPRPRAGVVEVQSPAAGAQAPQGSTIKLGIV